jgi:small basic protein (TIGR04137 family)
MSLDRTMKLQSGLTGSRSVLSRAERIARLATEGKFDLEKDNPLGLPKVKVRHSRAGTKAKKEVAAEEGEEGAEETTE